MRRWMLGRIAAWTVGAIATSAVAACSSSDPSASSDSAHTEGELASGNSPFYWAESSYLDFARIKDAADSPLDDTDPLTVRLQAWVDRFDAIVRDEMTRKYGSPFVAPKPIVKVLPSEFMFNAWVSKVPACLGKNDLFVHLERDFAYSDYPCLHPASWTSPSAFVDFWNASKPTCRVSLDASNAFQLSSSCDNPAPGPQSTGTMATSQYLHITTDLISATNENAVAVLLAHELGHYFRGHVSPAVSQKYDFWFDRQADQAKRPVPSNEADALKKAYDEIVHAPPPIGGARTTGAYSARLRPFLLNGLAPLLAERTEDDFVCGKARDLQGPWMTAMQNADVSAELDAKYLAWEAEVKACAARLRLTGTPGADAISMGRAIQAAIANAPRTHNVALHPYDAVSTLLDQLDALARKLDDAAARFLQHVRENRIGFYTIEEEADDFAMELATRAGLSTDDVLEAWLVFIKALDVKHASMSQEERDAMNGGIDATACEAAFRSGFTSFVPLGMIDEPHHANCYRLYNLWRESKVHHYTTGPAPAEMAPPWATLQEEAQRLTRPSAP